MNNKRVWMRKTSILENDYCKKNEWLKLKYRQIFIENNTKYFGRVKRYKLRVLAL